MAMVEADAQAAGLDWKRRQRDMVDKAVGAKIARKTVPIAVLPTIVDVLAVGEAPVFVILGYRDLIRFIAQLGYEFPCSPVSTIDYADEHAFVILSYEEFRAFIVTLDVTGDIDEEHYTKTHADVRAEIDRGALRNAREHYLFGGYMSQRSARLKPAR